VQTHTGHTSTDTRSAQRDTGHTQRDTTRMYFDTGHTQRNAGPTKRDKVIRSVIQATYSEIQVVPSVIEAIATVRL
jgi:hypothetical protein